MHMWYGVYGPFGNHWYGGMIMMIVGLVLIGIVVYLLLRNSGQASDAGFRLHRETPLEVLRRRFAEGAITEEEFLRMKQELDR